MIKNPCRIIFMGSPPFAVPSLVDLVQSEEEVIVVVTQPDRPKGRGGVVSATPVKKRALELGLPVIQPPSLKDDDLIRHISELEPDMIVVVALGQIVPKSLLSLPRLGVVNVHPSLLPFLRGPAPIQWAIIRGDKNTGVTTMFLDEKLDTGDILLSEVVPVLENDTAGSLHDRLAVIGSRLLIRTVQGLQAGEIVPVPQDHSRATYAPMLKKSDGLIRWNQPALSICNLIRGLDPWPGAYCTFKGKRLAFFGCSSSEDQSGGRPGELLGLHPKGLHIAAERGTVYIREVQLEGRKRIPAADFLRGASLRSGEILGS